MENIEDVKEPIIEESYNTKYGDVVKCEIGSCKDCYYQDKECWYIKCTSSGRKDYKSVRLILCNE